MWFWVEANHLYAMKVITFHECWYALFGFDQVANFSCFHVATSFCATTSCLCPIVAHYYSSTFSFTSLLYFPLCYYYLPLHHFLLLHFNCFLVSHCYLCACYCFLLSHDCCTLLFRYLLLHIIILLHFILVLLAFV
jgi:hypothetical protein